MVDDEYPTIETFLIRPNAYPVKVLEKGCPTLPDNRGSTVFVYECEESMTQHRDIFADPFRPSLFSKKSI